MATETRTLPCGAVIERYGIIGTTSTVYVAHRPAPAYQGYSSWQTIDGQACGRIGTERLPPELDTLPPMTMERSAAVQAWQEARYVEAYRLIFEAFPEAKCSPVGGGYRQSMGEIERWTN